MQIENEQALKVLREPFKYHETQNKRENTYPGDSKRWNELAQRTPKALAAFPVLQAEALTLSRMIFDLARPLVTIGVKN